MPEQVQVGHALQEAALEAVLAVEVVDLAAAPRARPTRAPTARQPLLFGQIEIKHEAVLLNDKNGSLFHIGVDFTGALIAGPTQTATARHKLTRSQSVSCDLRDLVTLCRRRGASQPQADRDDGAAGQAEALGGAGGRGGQLEVIGAAEERADAVGGQLRVGGDEPLDALAGGVDRDGAALRPAARRSCDRCWSRGCRSGRRAARRRGRVAASASRQRNVEAVDRPAIGRPSAASWVPLASQRRGRRETIAPLERAAHGRAARSAARSARRSSSAGVSRRTCVSTPLSGATKR